MRRFDQGWRNGPRRGLTPRLGLAIGTGVLGIGLVTPTGGGVAQAGSRQATTLSDPSAGHPYRHGAVPLRLPVNAFGAAVAPGRSGVRQAPARGHAQAAPKVHPNAKAQVRDGVRFGSGSVVAQSPKVYLVFWGSQWGIQSTGGDGYQHYTGDPDGLAPNLQAFFKGLGTDNETWSAVMTQYCQGVAFGAKTCPLAPMANHVAYPSATVLGGVWGDPSVTLSAATGSQIAQEASNAAVHFSNPAGAQYVIVSPTGTDPDQWLDPVNGYCAYHDNTQDPALAPVSGPDVPYTNLPYVPDVGADCSSLANPQVNDGADETASHEYAETLSDPFPISGWTDRFGNEIGDKCENVLAGSPGGATYIATATGTFAMQGIWANDLGRRGGCETGHSLILTASLSRQKATDGTPVALPIVAGDVRGLALSYSASGLPAGLTINPASGLISGVPVAHGRTSTTVRVSDASASTTIAVSWVIRR
jgi:hypothetical protein